MEGKKGERTFLSKLGFPFGRKQEEAKEDPRIAQFVESAKVAWPERSGKSAAEFAKELIRIGGPTLSLPVSVENIAEFERAKLRDEFALRIVGSMEPEAVQNIWKLHLKQLEVLVETTRKKSSSDLESAAIWVSKENNQYQSKSRKNEIFNKIMQGKPSTIWDLIILDPKAMFPPNDSDPDDLVILKDPKDI